MRFYKKRDTKYDFIIKEYIRYYKIQCKHIKFLYETPFICGLLIDGKEKQFESLQNKKFKEVV